MSQQINDNFEVLAGIPIDNRIIKPSIAERDAISSSRRFQGLQCFVEQTQTLYLLLGGTSNSNWTGIGGANVSGALETVIDGFYVLSAGKESLLDWEVGDKFRGWIGGRYLVGEILTLPVSLPADIDNTARVHLAVDSNVIGGGTKDFPLLAAPTTVFLLPTGAMAKAVYVNQARWFLESANNTGKAFTYTRSGNQVTLKTAAPINALVSIDY